MELSRWEVKLLHAARRARGKLKKEYETMQLKLLEGVGDEVWHISKSDIIFYLRKLILLIKI